MRGAAAVSRIDQLRSFIENNPDDPFPRYGLALEYKNGGQLEEANRAFALLIERFPEYVASYLHAGSVLVSLGRKAEAKQIYHKGIEAARAKQDTHSQGELEDALNTLGSD